MEYSPADSTASFRVRSFVRIPDARLSADGVVINLSGEPKEVRELRARGGVVFDFERYEGRGAEARYDPEADTLALTGDPVLSEKGRGDSRGDKLTFRLGDGRILIENKGQGRSITVVKS
jgi:lipopolysaccharide export system protein LptA